MMSEHAPPSDPTPPAPSDEIDLLAAGRLLGLGRKRLIKWAKAGSLPGRRDGFEWFFTQENLLEFAYQHCLECGGPNTTLGEYVYFCTHCASSFAPYQAEADFQWLSPMQETRQSLLLKRMQSQEISDQEAIQTLCQRYEISKLLAFQIWYKFHHSKEGTHRIGLGAVEFDGFKEPESEE